MCFFDGVRVFFVIVRERGVVEFSVEDHAVFEEFEADFFVFFRECCAFIEVDVEVRVGLEDGADKCDEFVECVFDVVPDFSEDAASFFYGGYVEIFVHAFKGGKGELLLYELVLFFLHVLRNNVRGL